ncbi:Ger(x)C family spore germination protein [Alkalihalobacillus sp. AL-G]|uniref:Ger(x)C family spore germination protein n=1 Tax=Alkalihalobacillus sp. AL-G TaxID=2926399 RepID=UPI00272B194A|nr:Ger(x)C family spore germination protein [Alkalihalobacillus sp. AL-G]WLD92950.1 Ger(x)C family spore germination protein [Alkalihalobacillus sp. AL-G]
MRKNTVKILITLITVSILSGCWDTKDINHRSLPIVMGVSMVEDQFKIHLQIPEPFPNTIQVKVVSETGETVSKAVDKLSTNMESRIDLLHVKVIVIDKELAKKGVKPLISGFMRARDVSPKALVVISDEEIEPFFSNLKNSTDPQGTTLFDFFDKSAGWNPQIALTRVWEVYRSIHSYTRDVAVPIVKSGESTLVEHLGSAILKNGKMVEHIETDETLLVNAFYEEGTYGKVEVMDEATVMIVGNKMDHKSQFIDQVPYLNSQLYLKVVLLETKGNPTSKEIKASLETLLTERFNEMFKKIQESEADILGTGQYFRTEIPSEKLKHWRSDYYPDLKVNLQVHTVIQNEGQLKLVAD